MDNLRPQVMPLYSVLTHIGHLFIAQPLLHSKSPYICYVRNFVIILPFTALHTDQNLRGRKVSASSKASRTTSKAGATAAQTSKKQPELKDDQVESEPEPAAEGENSL